MQAFPIGRMPAVTVSLFAFGVAINLYYSRFGYMPLDQSIVFDGAWRLMLGQVPFRDFAAPNGIVPALMQVPFFRVFGVTWLAYCLHASVVNGLYCVVAYHLLRMLEATRLEAAAAGALGAFFFYAPTGTPFMDQHAFFFTALLLAAVVAGSRAESRRAEHAAWALVPAIFLAGYLSCQIPTAFAALWIVAWVACHPARAPRWIGALTAGTLAAGACLLLAGMAWEVDWRSAFQYVVMMPLHAADVRTPTAGWLVPVRMILGTIRRLPQLAGLWSIDLACLAPLAVIVAGRRLPGRPIQIWTLLGLLVTTGAFLAYSKNETEAALGFAMPAAALAWVMARQSVAASGLSAAVRRPVLALLAGVVAVAAVRDAAVFITRVDATRIVLDTTYDARVAEDNAGQLPERLRFLRWTSLPAYDAKQLADALGFLQAADGNFLLIGDSTILYGLTGRPSVSPALWLDPGLSMPRPRTPEFQPFEAEILRRLPLLDVRRLVIEGYTANNVTLDDFPRLKALAESTGCGERSFGRLRIVELCG